MGSLRQELEEEQERIAARNAKIQKLLSEASAESEGESMSETEPAVAEEPKAKLVAIDQASDGTIIYRKMKAWEAMDAKGRVFQFRPMTNAEFQAEEERAFLKRQFQADQEHAAKVKEAERERAKEQKRLDEKRKHEERTGRRPMGKDTISLEEARRLGYLPSENQASGKPDWYSEGNPHGIMCGGR